MDFNYIGLFAGASRSRRAGVVIVAMVQRLCAYAALSLAFWGASRVAWAQGQAEPAPSAAEAAAPLAGPPAPRPRDAAWEKKYLLARERLMVGDFSGAAAMFNELAKQATDPADRGLASEQEQLAADWARRDLVLVRRADLGESAISAKAAGERTTDEIAVLYTNSVLYGLGTGAWLGVLTKPDSAAGAILPALGLAGAAAGAVALVDGHKKLAYGLPQSVVSGMYIGLEEGLVWTLWNQARARYIDEWHEETVASVIWGMTTAGAIAGGVVGAVGGTTPGRASFVGSAALWTGTVSGLLVGGLSQEDDAQDDRALLAAAIGVNAGAVAGAFAAGPVSPSIARVRFFDLGGLSGGVLFGGLYLAAAGDHPEGRAMMGALSLGMAGGLVAAWFATSGMPADRTDRSEASRSAVATVSPTIMPVAGGAALGLGGRF